MNAVIYPTAVSLLGLLFGLGVLTLVLAVCGAQDQSPPTDENLEGPADE